MKQIARDVYEAIQRSHPIEAMIWARWLRTGEARIVGITRYPQTRFVAWSTSGGKIEHFKM